MSNAWRPGATALCAPAVANIDCLVLLAANVNPVTDPFLLDGSPPSQGTRMSPWRSASANATLTPARSLRILPSGGLSPPGRSALRRGKGDGGGRGLPPKTVAFTGNSGVGKSSLLNCLAPGLGLAVGEVSKAGPRSAYDAACGAIFSGRQDLRRRYPGFSSFDTDQMDLILKENLQYAFPDFAPYLGKCQFHDCAHRAEPGCAVRAAVEAGAISPSRYDSYARLYDKAKEIRLWETKQR